MTLTSFRGKKELTSGERSPSGLLSALTVVVLSHTVNLLSALPLQCLDVLLMVPLEPGSEQCKGVNMDCVHTLVLFMERRLESVGAESGC